jgi:hypothetical protein
MAKEENLPKFLGAKKGSVTAPHQSSADRPQRQ